MINFATRRLSLVPPLLRGATVFARSRQRHSLRQFSEAPKDSSSPTTGVPSSNTTAAAAAVECKGASSTSLESKKASNQILLATGQVQRHGTGDAVIILNVGGKEFCTLRSTIAANPVLAEHVSRAEANEEFTHGGNAVFIDRDPTYFHLILNHLRNKVEGLSYYSSAASSRRSSNNNKKKIISYTPSLLQLSTRTKNKSSEYYVQLPKDINALRDIYVEAAHYRIPELEAASCEQNFIVTIVGAISGKNGNPFDKTTKFFQQLRRGMVTIGSMGTLAIGSQQDHSKFLSQVFPTWFPPSQDENNGTSSDDKKKSDNDDKSSPPQDAGQLATS